MRGVLSVLIPSVVMKPFFPRVRRTTTDPMSMRVASTNMDNPARPLCVQAIGLAVLMSIMLVSCVGGVPEVAPHMPVPIHQKGFVSLYSDSVSRVITTSIQNMLYNQETSTQQFDNEKLYDLYYHDYTRTINKGDDRKTCYADLGHSNIDVISGEHFPNDQCEKDLL